MMNLLVPHGFEANYTVGFARGLAANGVEFTVVSDNATAPAFAKAEIPHWNLRGSVDPGRPAREKLINLLRYYFRLLWTVFRYRGATIHFCGLLTSRFILFDGVLLPIWFRLWAGRYVHTAHNALPHSRGKSRLFRLLYRWIYRFPHAIVAHTGKIARQLETEFGVQPERIHIISIGLNEEVPETSLSAAEARLELGLPDTVPIALFFGKVEPYKGLDLLIEAWGRVAASEARLLIVGGCSDIGYEAQLRKAMRSAPNAETMEWREGFIPNEAVSLWFRACDVVVMPYRHIYQSGVVFLCLRFGTPIVATDVGSLAEYINSESGIICEPGNPAALSRALDQFFSDPNRFKREQIAQGAVRYRWDRQCAAIKHLYP